ncbi:hypothetical protein BJ322DRAFT_1219677 [Thelephora terrestris]|uniref:Uncharacterized protein n=1 Tax=Thelephora terrestris TaxID=56493 RepID=A0A9P6HB94_9AGAM|nr:hypothetical protein BJ322DRAFT_1219677 [Thelephora terrestris]
MFRGFILVGVSWSGSMVTPHSPLLRETPTRWCSRVCSQGEERYWGRPFCVSVTRSACLFLSASSSRGVGSLHSSPQWSRRFMLVRGPTSRNETTEFKWVPRFNSTEEVDVEGLLEVWSGRIMAGGCHVVFANASNESFVRSSFVRVYGTDDPRWVFPPNSTIGCPVCIEGPTVPQNIYLWHTETQIKKRSFRFGITSIAALSKTA